jgi:hypothetical protein
VHQINTVNSQRTPPPPPNSRFRRRCVRLEAPKMQRTREDFVNVFFLTHGAVSDVNQLLSREMCDVLCFVLKKVFAVFPCHIHANFSVKNTQKLNEN